VTLREMSQDKSQKSDLDLVRWILFYGNSDKTLFEIAKELKEPVHTIRKIFDELQIKSIIQKVTSE
jgi:aminopeptidase-like protein